MQVIHIDKVDAVAPSVVCLGNFDGVHLGHQAVIRQAVFLANEAMPAIAYTFSRLPANQLSKGKSTPLITSNKERVDAMGNLGVNCIVMDPFRPSLSSMEPKDFFCRILLDTLNAKAIVCGTNYRFGAGGGGDTALLSSLCEEAGITLHLVRPVSHEGRVISSSWIRALISEGEMELAHALIGRPYCLTASVVHGEKRGRKLGVPTMNQLFPDWKLRPKEGVYAARAELDGHLYAATTCVSTRPTFGGSGVNSETHILGFDGDLYGRVVTISFLKRTRGIISFESPEILRQQLLHDIEDARKVFDKYTH